MNKRLTNEEKIDNAADKLEELKLPEVWDTLSNLINMYDDEKPEGYKKMISLFEELMAKTLEDPKYNSQFQALLEMATKFAAKLLLSQDYQWVTGRHGIQPQDLAHDSVINILQRSADYNYTRGDRGGFVFNQVQRTLTDLIRSLETEKEREELLELYKSSSSEVTNKFKKVAQAYLRNSRAQKKAYKENEQRHRDTENSWRSNDELLAEYRKKYGEIPMSSEDIQRFEEYIAKKQKPKKTNKAS